MRPLAEAYSGSAMRSIRALIYQKYTIIITIFDSKTYRKILGVFPDKVSRGKSYWERGF